MCDQSLWKRILISIHNIKSLKASSDSFGVIKNGTWASLMSNVADVKRVRDVVEEGLIVKVGDGTSTLFWHDKWVNSGPIKQTFPRLFSISEQRDAYINDMGYWRDNAWVWRFRWRRQLFVWEMDELERLKILIEQVVPRNGESDGICWYGEQNRFPIKRIMDKLQSATTPPLSKSIASLIWKIKAPPRATIVIWLACLEKLKTGDSLVEKGVIDVTNAFCPLCSTGVETNSHILFSCRFSWNIWMKILNWWGINGVLHSHCTTFILSWCSLRPKKCNRKKWMLVLGCAIWSLWFLRNRSKFEGGTVDLQNFFNTLKIRMET